MRTASAAATAGSAEAAWGGAAEWVLSKRPDGKKVLQRISKETGGGFF